MGACGVEGHVEILAESGKLEIQGRGRHGALGEKPQSPLEGAEDLAAGREVKAQALVPSTQELAVESGVVSDKLRDMVRGSFGGEHGEGGMATEKRGEALGGFPGFESLLGPEAPTVVILSQGMALGGAFVK